MKKVIVVLLLVALCVVCFAACNEAGGAVEPADTPSSPSTPIQPSTPDTPSTPTQPTTPTVQMTASYAKARAEFEAVTGVELPAIASIEVQEYPYREGDTGYCLDIVGGSGLSRATFDALKAFLDTALADWTSSGPTASGEYTNVDYNSARGWIGLTWDDTNKAVYVNATMGTNSQPNDDPVDDPVAMTASYRAGRDGFHQISGLWLPELTGVEMDAASTFDVQKKEAEVKLAKDSAVLAAVVSALKTELARYPLADNPNHWEQEGFGAFWEWDYEDGGRMHKVTIQVTQDNTSIEVGYWFRDYYTVALSATAGGTATLRISGTPQNGNTAHVCYNTACELGAEAAPGYTFAGFYAGDTLLGAEAPYTYRAVRDVTITAKFEEIPSNMDAGYKTARNALYDMSGILLPALENATTTNVTIRPDEAGVSDEFDCSFVFATADDATAAFAQFATAIALVEGEAEEEMAGMTLWSVLYPDAPVPYRDDVMMNVDDASVNLLWRKQPIVYYYVQTEGPGSAYIPYTDWNYQEQHVQSHWQIAVAFSGRVVAVPDTGKVFDGWYVDGQRVSTDSTYYFDYAAADVTFTSITFVAKFSAPPPVQMTESYAQGRAGFLAYTGYTLPEFGTVTAMYESQQNYAMLDVAGATSAMWAEIRTALQQQIGAAPTEGPGGSDYWEYSREIEETTCDCTLTSSFVSDENMVVLLYTVAARETVQMTETYALARTQFHAVTGVWLPELAGIEMDEDYVNNIYHEGDTSYTFDLCGEAVTADTFDAVKAVLDNLEDWEFDRFQRSDVFDFYYYAKAGGGSIQLVWHRAEEGAGATEGVYVNAIMSTETE